MFNVAIRVRGWAARGEGSLKGKVREVGWEVDKTGLAANLVAITNQGQ